MCWSALQSSPGITAKAKNPGKLRMLDRRGVENAQVSDGKTLVCALVPTAIVWNWIPSLRGNDEEIAGSLLCADIADINLAPLRLDAHLEIAFADARQFPAAHGGYIIKTEAIQGGRIGL